MADTTLNPLPSGTKLVNDDGTPTLFFQRWAQNRSIDISKGITIDQLMTMLSEIHVIAGDGLAGGGPIDADVTLSLPILSGVSGTYTNASVTVDNHGRIVVAANGSAAAYNFTGGGVTVSVSTGNFVQKSNGQRNSGNLTLPATATLNNTLVIVYTGSSAGPSTPAGFTSVATAANSSQYIDVFTKTSNGTETAIAVTNGDNGSWIMYEFPPVTSIALASTPNFTFPFTVPTSTTSAQIFTFEQDGGSAFPVTPTTGGVVDYTANGAGGNHIGAIGHLTVSSGGVVINGTIDGSTNLAGVISVTAAAGMPVTTVNIPGVTSGGAQVTSIVAGTNITLTDVAGALTISSSGGGGGGGGGSGAVTKIQQIVTVGTETSVNFTAIPQTYDDLILVVSGAARGSGLQLFHQVNGDTGNNYSFYRWNHYGASNAIGTSHMDLATFGVDASDGEITVAGYARTVAKKIFHAVSGFNSASDDFPQIASGEWNSTAAITSISSFVSDAGAFPAGTVFTLYGRGGTGGAAGGTPALVQMATLRNDGTIALPSAPTVGNLLVLMTAGYAASLGSYAANLGLNKCGYFQTDVNNGVQGWARRVQGGDTGSYALSASDNQAAVLYEFSGAITCYGYIGGFLATNSSNWDLNYLPSPFGKAPVVLAAIENDSTVQWTVNSTAGVTADYITDTVSGNHTSAFVRINQTINPATVAGTISSGSYLNAVFGMFVVVGA